MSCFHGKLQACVLQFGGRLLCEAGPLRRRGGGQPGRHDGVERESAKARLAVSTVCCAIACDLEVAATLSDASSSELRGPGVA